MRRIISNKTLLIVLTILVCVFIQILTLPWTKTVNAVPVNTDWSWSSGEPRVFSSTIISSPNTWCYGFFQNEEIEGQFGTQKVCMSSKSNIKFGTYYNGSEFIPVVGFPYDTKMYKVNGICGQYDNCKYLPGSDSLATMQYLINGMVRSLVVYKNFISRLTQVNNGFTKEYNFDKSNPDYIFQSENGYAWPINSFGASDDGNWLAVEFRQRGLGLLNIDTLQMKRVSTASNGFSLGSNASTEIAVSNEGEQVAIMGIDAGLMVFSVNSGCGDEAADSNMEMASLIYQPCELKRIDTSTFIDRFYAAIRPRFTEDGGGLSFYAYSYNNEWKEVSLRAAGYGGQKIDYLALGDSFTSGEGETDDNYYLRGTNNKNEKCHVSIRSYPYLISDSMNIESLGMASVACSGATTKDVVGANGDYWGQGERLKDKKTPNKSDKIYAQSSALYNFLPGRIHQETFIKEYGPKIITIGIGGNDAGLMEKLSACAGKDTCDWASNDESKEQTADEIKNLFGILVKTYQSLSVASSSSKIYAIGYPKIIDQDGKCDAITGFLFDETERKFMNESVAYLNQIVEAAAKSAGIKFIDIQKIYGDRVLCGSESPSAMNGARTGDDNQYNWFLNIGNESFHPNPLGHTYAAKAVIKSVGNLMDYKYCTDENVICPDGSVVAPEPSTYWIPDINHDYPSQKIANYLSDSDDVSDNRQKQIQLDDGSLMPNSNVEIEITSEPISLGNFTTSPKGSLNINLDLPINLEEGYHTMHLYGTSYSGESVELYQVFEYRKPIDISTEKPQITNTNSIDTIKDKESAASNDQDISTNIYDTADSSDEQINQIAYFEKPEVKGDYVVENNALTRDKKISKDNTLTYLPVYAFIGITILLALSISTIKILRAHKTS